jgi:hypothetical protein
MSQRQYSRAMPPKQQQPPTRNPQPSIKSAQVFTQQQQQGMQRHQQGMQRQQQSNNMQPPKLNKNDYYEETSGREVTSTGTGKITVAQAITLITLRLGSVENKLASANVGQDQSIVERLEQLEEKSATSSSSSNENYNQQLDALTQALIQNKNTTSSVIKENKELKTQINSLKKELEELKKTVDNVQQIATRNESKIFQLLLDDSDQIVDDGQNVEYLDDENSSFVVGDDVSVNNVETISNEDETND